MPAYVAPPDSRKLPIALLNERRREAVRLRLGAATLASIRERTNLSLPTIIAAHRAFLDGGWDAVPVRPRGRRPGDGRLVSGGREALLMGLMVAQTPDALGLAYLLWQTRAIQDLVRLKFHLELPARGASNYLQRWGLSVVRPASRLESDAAPLQRWRETVYRSVQRRARADRAPIFWVEETALRGVERQPSVPRANVVRAVSNRGKQFWLAYEGVLRAPILIDFLDRLLRVAGGRAIVILDGMQWRRAAAVASWMAERSDRLLAFHLPDLSGTLDVAMPLLSVAGADDGQRNADPSARPRRLRPPQLGLLTPYIRHLITGSFNRHGSYAAKIPRGNQRAMSLTHLQRLEAETMNIMREVVAESERPVMLYSIGKDSAVMLHLAMQAFYPAKPPFPLLHVDTTWKFKAMYAHRDRMAKELGMELLVHINTEGLAKGINPFTHGSSIHTDIMKTQGLKQALDKYGFDAAFGGARRDEEKSRAKERIFSFRSGTHRWDPKAQRPELWSLYNTRKHKGESFRVFPISNWTELDIWQYIYLKNIPIPDLYLAKRRPVVERDGVLIMVDDERMPLRDGEVPMMRSVRFRTLGCYPLSGAVESEAATLPDVIQEMLLATTSERQGRLIDHDSAGSMEKKKQEGYF